MSYSEANDQVILTMSREDYEAILIRLGVAAMYLTTHGGNFDRELDLLNRLNHGNPHYTPYQVEEKS